MSKTTITPRENGPLAYLGDGEKEDLIKNSKGEVIENKKEINFCRCGGSKNKPYCDGTHMSNGFSSKNESDKSKNKRDNYEGREIVIHDNRGICAHSGVCTDNLKNVFRMKQEPWIGPNGASAQEIVDVVTKCPSGALSYSVNDKELVDGDEKSILISKDGPYCVKGEIELVGAEFGEGARKKDFALCRCGGSKNKPFCDGTHWYIKFKDERN